MPTHRNTRAHTHTCTHCAYAKLLFCIAHHTMPDSPAGLRREDHVLKLLLSHWILQNASFLYTVISYVQLGTLTQKTIGTTDKLFLFDQIWILCFFTPNNSNIFWIYLKKTLLTQSYEMKQINSPQIHFYVKYEFQIRRRTYTYSCIITRQEDILLYIWTPLLISEKKILKSSFFSFFLSSYNPTSFFQDGVTAVALLRKARAMRNNVSESCPVRYMVPYCVREPSVARRGGRTSPWVRCWRDAECCREEPLPRGEGENGSCLCRTRH